MCTSKLSTLLVFHHAGMKPDNPPLSSSSMTPVTTRVFVVEGLKISLDILQDISSDLPISASIILNLVQRVISIAEVRRLPHW